MKPFSRIISGTMTWGAWGSRFSIKQMQALIEEAVGLGIYTFDHADIYKDIGSIQTQFHHLIRTMPSKGHILFPENDENIQEVISQGSWSNKVTYGDQSISDWNLSLIHI